MKTIKLITLSCLVISGISMGSAMARVSLGGIDTKLDEINNKLDVLNTTQGEFTKVVLMGDLEEGVNSLSGTDRVYEVPSNKRFHIQEVACSSQGSYTAALGSRPFALTIQGRYFDTNLNRTIRQNVIATEFLSSSAPNFATILTTVWSSNTFFSSSEKITLFLTRRGGGTTGSINDFACTLSGFMQDL